MKLNKTKLRKILAVILIVIALATFLKQYFAPAEEAYQPAESSTVQEMEEEPSAPAEEAEPSTEEPAEEEQSPEETPAPEEEAQPEPEPIDENSSYSSMQEVADYIHTFGKLPPNYLTKNE
ncbi:MAG: hypothetical protein J6Q99_04475, partial [Oscillospiraceae bacterium]|nr:hypothetical protein [Oscillospiraceae bacterium]